MVIHGDTPIAFYQANYILFIHFGTISFIAEKRGQLVAFLIGFLSPSQPDVWYIHFAGVHPDYRTIGVGRTLYYRFFTICRDNGRNTVGACTSSVNKASIAFHQKLGFSLSDGDADIDGIPVTLDYNRPGNSKVLFEKHIV